MADQIAANQAFLGVIGGAFSGETRATKVTFHEAGVTMISQSATATDLTQDEPVAGVPPRRRLRRGPGCGHRALPHRGRGQEGLRRRRQHHLRRPARPTRSRPGSATSLADSDKAQEKQTEFSAIVAKVKAGHPGRRLLRRLRRRGGSVPEAAACGGRRGPFVGGDGLYGSDFPKAAGDAGRRRHRRPARASRPTGRGHVRRGLRGRVRHQSGAYAAEGFDAMNIFLAGFADGVDSRERWRSSSTTTTGDGITKHNKFDENGDVRSRTSSSGPTRSRAAPRPPTRRSRSSSLVTNGAVDHSAAPWPDTATADRPLEGCHGLQQLVRLDRCQHRQRADQGLDLRARRAGLHARVRRAAPHQLRPLRGVHGGHLDGARASTRSSAPPAARVSAWSSSQRRSR